jgi:hypothetical protein
MEQRSFVASKAAAASAGGEGGREVRRPMWGERRGRGGCRGPQHDVREEGEKEVFSLGASSFLQDWIRSEFINITKKS